MKFLGALLIAATMFASCEKDSAEETPKAITVADSKSLTQEVFADKTQTNDGVTFVTTGAWTSTIAENTTNAKSSVAGVLRATSASPDWISISPESGGKAGSYTIAITLVPNTTGADRTAIITISCEDTEITISVTQKATQEDGTVPTEMTQEEIIALLIATFDNSLNVSELAIAHTDYNDDNEVDIIEINRGQKKSLVSTTFNNTVYLFKYIENTARYLYSTEKGIVKKREMLSADFWDTYNVKEHTAFLEYIKEDEDWYDFSVYSWTGSGNNYVGIRTREGVVRKLTVTLDTEKINTVKWEIPNETHDITFSYSNVNPAFPGGFDKADFTVQYRWRRLVACAALFTSGMDSMSAPAGEALDMTRSFIAPAPSSEGWGGVSTSSPLA